MNIWFHLFAKKVNGWSDKYEIWCVEQFNKQFMSRKKFKIAFLSWNKYLPNISTTFITEEILGEVFTSHIRVGLAIFIPTCFFLDLIATDSVLNLLVQGFAINSHPNSENIMSETIELTKIQHESLDFVYFPFFLRKNPQCNYGLQPFQVCPVEIFILFQILVFKDLPLQNLMLQSFGFQHVLAFICVSCFQLIGRR